MRGRNGGPDGVLLLDKPAGLTSTRALARAKRALGSTVGFAVLGSVLAAFLTMTLGEHLAHSLPDPVERKEVVETIIGNATPRAYTAEIGPGRPIQHVDPATQAAILTAADSDFVQGIRMSLATAILVLAIVLAAGYAWFPRGKGGIEDAKREEGKLEKQEDGRVPEMG